MALDRNHQKGLRLYRILIILIALLFLVFTNRWLTWDQGIIYLTANDVYAYAKISAAAPTLNPENLTFHHAQRLTFPYLLGSLAKLTSIEYQHLFQATVFLCHGIVVFCVDRILVKLKLSKLNYALCISLLILNPYTFRYYWIVPGMLPDVIFVTGLSIALTGLVGISFIPVAIGISIAALGRQTALVAIPGIILWLTIAAGWSNRSIWQRLRYSLVVISISIGIYQITGSIASTFALPSDNVESISGLFKWLSSDRFSLPRFAEHLLRLVIPAALIAGSSIGIHLGSKRSSSLNLAINIPVESWASILITVGIIAQPFLSGPEISGQNSSRLAALGLVPLIVALAFSIGHIDRSKHQIEIDQKINPEIYQVQKFLTWKVILGCCILIGSLHHLYTKLGPPNALMFAITQITLTSIAGYASFSLRRIREISSSTPP